MPERPNILFVMTDQQRGDCLGIEGHPALLTPTMDAIAGAGTRFSRAYATCPSCVAARRSLLSGQYPVTHGLVGYADGIEWNAPPTLPGVLAANGYQTVLVGRSMHQHPPRKRYGYQHMVQMGWDSDYDEWLAAHQPPGSGGMYGSGVMHNDWTARPWHMDEGLHPTNWTVNQAIEFLRKRDPSCPFFLTVSFIAPHPPLNPPACYFERYLRTTHPDPVIGDWAEPLPNGGRGMGQSASQVMLDGEALRSARAGYYGHINHIDDQLNRLLNPVTGIDRLTGGNTIVVFTSDHGEMLGDHHLFRKSLPFEPSARIPMLIRPPARAGFAKGATCPAVACLEDLMPTLLDLAGVPIPETVDGQSLVPWMRGETPTWRADLHIEHAGNYQAITDARYKYAWRVADGRELLFDLQADPQERHNLATEAPELLATYRQRLIERLIGRPEGFTDGKTLISGASYHARLPHAGTPDPAPMMRKM